MELVLDVSSHIKFFQRSIQNIPYEYVTMDTSRLTALYFNLVSLDILGVLDTIDKSSLIEYIYMHQLLTPTSDSNLKSTISNNNTTTDEIIICGRFGFIGSPYIGINSCFGHFLDENTVNNSNNYAQPCLQYQLGHLAMTYTALVSLITLGDDLSRVNKSQIMKGMPSLQDSNGSFRATLDGNESDVRFIYCACAISVILNDWSGVNRDLAASFIRSCLTYEGGISLTPGIEAHGGSCYCGIAALVLMNKLEVLRADEIDNFVRWCEQRQLESGGYQGRTNKDPDSCYSFWIGASLSILNRFHDSDLEKTKLFLLKDCQCKYTGGFSKFPDGYPDIFHSYYSLCWLSMIGDNEKELKPVDELLGLCMEKSPFLNNNHCKNG
eukprot:gene10652-14306_t